jgi:hypothetical protein
MLGGFALMVGDTAYVEGSASAGEPIETVVYESSGGPGGPGGEPPEGGAPGGQPPEGGGPGGGEKPAGEPPAKPE